MKYIGVFVGNKLSWNHHISHVSTKATKVLNLLQHHMHNCEASSKFKSFRVLVLDYASVFWNPIPRKVSQHWIKYRIVVHACGVCGSRFNPISFKQSKSSEDCCQELCWPLLSCQWCVVNMYLYLNTFYLDFTFKST